MIRHQKNRSVDDRMKLDLLPSLSPSRLSSQAMITKIEKLLDSEEIQNISQQTDASQLFEMYKDFLQSISHYSVIGPSIQRGLRGLSAAFMKSQQSRPIISIPTKPKMTFKTVQTDEIEKEVSPSPSIDLSYLAELRAKMESISIAKIIAKLKIIYNHLSRIRKDVPELTQIPEFDGLEIQSIVKSLETCFTDIKQNIQQNVIEKEAPSNFKIMADKEVQVNMIDNSRDHFFKLLKEKEIEILNLKRQLALNNKESSVIKPINNPPLIKAEEEIQHLRLSLRKAENATLTVKKDIEFTKNNSERKEEELKKLKKVVQKLDDINRDKIKQIEQLENTVHEHKIVGVNAKEKLKQIEVAWKDKLGKGFDYKEVEVKIPKESVSGQFKAELSKNFVDNMCKTIIKDRRSSDSSISNTSFEYEQNKEAIYLRNNIEITPKRHESTFKKFPGHQNFEATNKPKKDSKQNNKSNKDSGNKSKQEEQKDDKLSSENKQNIHRNSNFGNKHNYNPQGSQQFNKGHSFVARKDSSKPESNPFHRKKDEYKKINSFAKDSHKNVNSFAKDAHKNPNSFAKEDRNNKYHSPNENEFHSGNHNYQRNADLRRESASRATPSDHLYPGYSNHSQRNSIKEEEDKRFPGSSGKPNSKNLPSAVDQPEIYPSMRPQLTSIDDHPSEYLLIPEVSTTKNYESGVPRQANRGSIQRNLEYLQEQKADYWKPNRRGSRREYPDSLYSTLSQDHTHPNNSYQNTPFKTPQEHKSMDFIPEHRSHRHYDYDHDQDKPAEGFPLNYLLKEDLAGLTLPDGHSLYHYIKNDKDTLKYILSQLNMTKKKPPVKKLHSTIDERNKEFIGMVFKSYDEYYNLPASHKKKILKAVEEHNFQCKGNKECSHLRRASDLRMKFLGKILPITKTTIDRPLH